MVKNCKKCGKVLPTDKYTRNSECWKSLEGGCNVKVRKSRAKTPSSTLRLPFQPLVPLPSSEVGLDMDVASTSHKRSFGESFAHDHTSTVPDSDDGPQGKKKLASFPSISPPTVYTQARNKMNNLLLVSALEEGGRRMALKQAPHHVLPFVLLAQWLRETCEIHITSGSQVDFKGVGKKTKEFIDKAMKKKKT